MVFIQSESHPTNPKLMVLLNGVTMMSGRPSLKVVMGTSRNGTKSCMQYYGQNMSLFIKRQDSCLISWFMESSQSFHLTSQKEHS